MTRASHVRQNAGNTAKRPSKAEKRQARQEVKVEEQAPRVTPVQPKTPGQRRYFTALKTNTMTIAIGPAGTGKTFLAAGLAAQMFLAGQIKEIILVRPAVEAGEEKHGFLPGDINKKLAPWAAPVINILNKKLGAARVMQMIARFELRIEPFTYMRGLTFEDAFVILDEAQNTTVEQMKLFTTRIGENCKVVIDGDIKQNDLERRGIGSGLRAVMEIAECEQMGDVALVTLGVEDIVRGPMTKAWVKGWDNHEAGAHKAPNPYPYVPGPIRYQPLVHPVPGSAGDVPSHWFSDDRTISDCVARFVPAGAFAGFPGMASPAFLHGSAVQPVANPVDG